MSAKFIFPGSFCPPTWGHANLATQASKAVPDLIINCSWNPEKDNWFSMEECAALWKAYDLPENVRVRTFNQLKDRKVNFKEVVMVRGLRDEASLRDEAKVMSFNMDHFGISQYLYLLSKDKYKDVSSTRAREAAQNADLETLSHCVAPLVATALLEKALDLKNVFMVVGKPGGGKSTFLTKLTELDRRNIHINTDLFNKDLKPMVEKAFPGQDLVQLALNHPDELSEAIGKPWIDLLGRALLAAPKGSNVFVECAYGLCPDKSIFRYVGGKVLYLGCTDAEHHRRVSMRDTPELTPFIDKIPGLCESQELAQKNNLELTFLDTSCPLDQLDLMAKSLSETLNERR